ncbi:PPE domain-containing protein [Mycobacterium uberis]|uniref:PPE domain-containing protein n=1 Tax=Mycobacterium uberis TaxID=2162698 RepID=UPI000E300BD2|nr:hypothetical protein [Mycobacterium uberis]
MSATFWMASLPEVHSVLLSADAGQVSMLATAAAWSKRCMRKAEYRILLGSSRIQCGTEVFPVWVR